MLALERGHFAAVLVENLAGQVGRLAVRRARLEVDPVRQPGDQVGFAVDGGGRVDTSPGQDLLIQEFPQGANRSEGEVIAIGPLGIPTDFPVGPAVMEVWNQTPMDAYIDCLDVFIQTNADEVFFDGFEN